MNSAPTQVKNNSAANVRKAVSSWTRWIHIYLSMFSFAALLFFAVTGITLNHPAWIEGREKVRTEKGDLPAALLIRGDSIPVNQLQTVEYFRNTHKIKARLTDFLVDDVESTVSFKGPGYSADAFIDNETGYYELTITESGLVAVMNDLHKGRDTGVVWPAVIDISAILMIIVSVTGFMMIFFLRKKRLNGLLLFLAGAVILLFLYYAYGM